MQATADAFDWDCFLIVKYISMEMRNMTYEMIRRSLYADLWTPEQLDTLRALVLRSRRCTNNLASSFG